MPGETHNHDCMATFKESLLILLFEFLGTCFLTALFTSCYATGDLTGLLCGFFILLIFSARISGSHFNPAITLAFMFRRDTGRFSRMLGLLYIAAQYCGAILGATIAYNLFSAGSPVEIPTGIPDVEAAVGTPPLSVSKNMNGTTLLIQAIFQEIIGSMLITFLYLTQTEEKTKMSGDPAITTLIIAATYTATVAFSESSGVMSGSPYNPASALGLAAAILFKGDTTNTSNTWMFLIFSYLGSGLAVFLFEFVYKKAMTNVEQANDDDEENEQHDALISPTAAQ